VLTQLVERNPDEVRTVYRHFPLPNNQLGLIAAHASEAAGQQGYFWEMHTRIFESQSTWVGMTPDQFRTWLNQQAGEIGINIDQFQQDITSDAVIERVDAAQQHGLEIGIPGTPLVLLNGQFYQGPRDLASLESILQLFRLEDRQITYCPPMVIDQQREYTAIIKTDKGDIVIQLFPDQAPLTVNSFVFLAREGWFDNITFHRVLPNYIAQSGDPSGTGFGGPGYTFDDEITDLRFDKPGVVGMANSGPGSNGSQFFITYREVPNLDGTYTVFGQVIEGFDVLESLMARDPAQQPDLPPGDIIETIDIREQ
jgi:cyclophilin family peptidyl-prolyl cis-trans isomerase